MKWAGIVLILIVLIFWVWRGLRISPRLMEGDTAPEFQLKDQTDTMRALKAYRGRWLVLYFYPRDATPGCTREACNFRDKFLKIQSLNAEIIGISVNGSDSHARFASQHQLPFPLLADTDGQTAAAYGALFRLGPLRFARRHTFILTPEGRMGKIFRQVNPDHHAAEISAALEALQRKPAPSKLVPAQ